MKNTLSWLILAFILTGSYVSAQAMTEEDPEYQAIVSLCSAEAEGELLAPALPEHLL